MCVCVCVCVDAGSHAPDVANKHRRTTERVLLCPTSGTVQTCFQQHAAHRRSPQPRPRAPHGAARRVYQRFDKYRSRPSVRPQLTPDQCVTVAPQLSLAVVLSMCAKTPTSKSALRSCQLHRGAHRGLRVAADTFPLFHCEQTVNAPHGPVLLELQSAHWPPLSGRLCCLPRLDYSNHS